ncbi:MAG: hypothetical protein RL180_1697 [Pseudomonadota bacterium]
MVSQTANIVMQINGEHSADLATHIVLGWKIETTTEWVASTPLPASVFLH